MDTVALANFFAGPNVEPGPLIAWRVDRTVSGVLGVPIGTPVRLSYPTFSKITVVHREIGFDDFARLPIGISAPNSFVSRGRKLSAEITIADPSRPLRVILRRARDGNVYIVSIYRLDWPEVRRRFRRETKESRIVRGPETKLARQLMPRQS